VWHCHGLDGAPPFFQTFARECRCVIAISGFVAGTLAGMGLPPEQIRTVVNAIDFDRVRASAAIPPASPLPRPVAPGVVLLPAASLRPVKGMHALLQAAKLVPDAQVWLTGDTHDPAAAQYVKQLLAIASSPELTGRVHFLGFRPDIYSVMQAADIVCVPSTYLEGFGLVAAEAMCLGKPVIVSNRGALPEVAAHGEAALVIDPDQPASLAKAIEKLIVQKNYASRLGIAARTSAIQRFSYVRWAREVAAVLAAGASVAPTVRQPITDTVSTESPYESVR
jgi:glycosyltransferase involved in cell wall biosynthesis